MMGEQDRDRMIAATLRVIAELERQAGFQREALARLLQSEGK